MPKPLVVEFTKMQAAGNDFLVLDDRWYRFSDEELQSIAATWCPRRFGVGADGLLAFAEAEGDADFRMRYVNADGSPATMCGNGARCLARYARTSGVDAQDLSFETDAGLYRAHVPDDPDAPVRLFVPEPKDLALNRPMERPLPDGLDGVHYVWTGTEHLVAFVDDASATPVDAWGAHLRRDPSLEPTGANANFVSVRSGDNGTPADADVPELVVRTFEKGVEGETMACGTGVLAAAVVAQETGRAGDVVPVSTSGGPLRVGRDDGALYLEGPAHTVYRGTLNLHL